METKVCKECGQSLPISNFSKNKATKDGLANYCKKCDKERRRKSSGGITQQGVKATLKMSDFDEDLVCYDFSNWWDNMDDIEQVKEYRKHE